MAFRDQLGQRFEAQGTLLDFSRWCALNLFAVVGRNSVGWLLALGALIGFLAVLFFSDMTFFKSCQLRLFFSRVLGHQGFLEPLSSRTMYLLRYGRPFFPQFLPLLRAQKSRRY